MTTSKTPWVIMHIPHASRLIPPDVRDQFFITEAELQHEIDRLTDHYTDELFSVNKNDVVTLTFPINRFVVDPERFSDDVDEPMAKHGQGVIYMKTTDQKQLRRVIQADEREELLNKYYRPHHHKLESLVDNALGIYGKALIIDGHSFPRQPLPVDLDQNPDRPDICLGIDAFHTPQELIEALQETCTYNGFSVAINRPYSGTIVPLKFYHRNSKVVSIMIEINRSLYLQNEPDDIRRNNSFYRIHQLIAELVDQAILLM